MGRNHSITQVGWAIACITLAACGMAWAQQQPPPPPPKSGTLAVQVDLVVLDVAVTRNRRNVRGLTRHDFQVFENGREQKIEYFHSGDAPATIGLVIDSSSSMMRKRDEVVTASLAFVAARNPADDLFVTHFNDVVASGFPSGERFSSDPEQIRGALLAVKPVGRTSLYDAIIEALKYQKDGRHPRHALVVVSDGGDNQSRHTLDDVVEQVRRSNVTIYTIGIYDRGARDRNPGALRKLAGISGGKFFEPARLAQIHDICQLISRDLRTRYTLAFAPEAGGDAQSFRKVQVKVQSPQHGKLEAHTRPGYQPSGAHAAKKQ